MQNDQMFNQMLNAAKTWLKDRQPEDIAQKAKVIFDGKAFYFASLGVQVTVRYPDYHITPLLEQWHQLVILHYLSLADGTPLTGKCITFAQQRDGMIRGGGFDRKAEHAISRIDFEKLKQRCVAFGGKEKKTNADYCVEIPFLPMYPVMLTYWQGDEEFPASGRLLPDASAEHYLTIEDAVTAGELILQKLEE